MVNTLIVDDKKFIRQGIACMLQNYDSTLFQIKLCSNGREALEHIKHNQTDILITDIRMPEMDGIELMKKTKMENPELQVIVISGYNDFKYAKESIKYGVRDYLLKPINEDELIQCVESIKNEMDIKRKEAKKNYTYEAVLNEIYNYEPTQKGLELKNKMNTIEDMIIIMGNNDRRVLYDFMNQIKSYLNDEFVEVILRALNHNLKSLCEIYFNTNAEKTEQMKKLELLASNGNYTEYIRALEPFLMQLNQIMLIEKTKHQNKAELRNAIEYINKNYYRDLSLDMVANNSSLSYAYFSHKFKECMGLSFTGYLTKVRVKNAKELLTGTDLRIYEIARKVGFQSDKHFVRTFKSMIGVTPTEYRLQSKMNKSNINRKDESDIDTI